MVQALYEKAHRPGYQWGGANKNIVRQAKIDYCKSFGFADPVCLTLPGATAVFEEMLINESVADPDNIVGIQRTGIRKNPAGKIIENGREILELLKQRARELGIRAYGVDLLTLTRERFPDYIYSNSGEKGHRNILSKGVNIFDIDTMHSVGKEMTDALANVFNHKMPAKESALMINNVRGRYHPSTRRMMRRSLTKQGLAFASACTFSTTTDIQRRALFAFVAIPVFYSCLAATRGYALTLDKIIDYRDKNQKTGMGNSMAQCLFSCRKVVDKQKALEVALNNERLTRTAVLEEWAFALPYKHYDEGGLYTKHTD